MRKCIVLLLAVGLLFVACDDGGSNLYGKIGDADQTTTSLPGNSSTTDTQHIDSAGSNDGHGDAVDMGDTPLEGSFEERMAFLSGTWFSHAGGTRLDGYRIWRWSDVTDEDREKMRIVFPALEVDSLRTYSGQEPKDSDYILLYDDMVYGQPDDGEGENEGFEGFDVGYMGLVLAVNTFNNDIERGSIIIEYFEGADPLWLSLSQGLMPGERPFFGLYYRVLTPNTVQFANTVNLAAMYAGKPYFTETKTFQEAINAFTVENEAEYVSWAFVPHDREKDS